MTKWASYLVKSDCDQSHLKEKGCNKKWKNKPSTFKNGSTKWVKKQQNSDIAQYNQKTDPIPAISNFHWIQIPRTYHIHLIFLKQVILLQTTIYRNFGHKAVFRLHAKYRIYHNHWKTLGRNLTKT